MSSCPQIRQTTTKRDSLLKKIQRRSQGDSHQRATPPNQVADDESLKKVLKMIGQDATPAGVSNLRKQLAEKSQTADSFSVTGTTTYETMAVDQVTVKEDFEFSLSAPSQSPGSKTIHFGD
jgi:hypothetical protein